MTIEDDDAGSASRNWFRAAGADLPSRFAAAKSSVAAFAKRGFRNLRLARAIGRRDRSKALFIGVTGSSAKSTTTALLAHILRAKGEVMEQVGYNSRGDLIKTLRTMPRAADFVVVEAGVGGTGQMKPIAGLLRPDVAIVTLIAQEHYSAFRSREAVAEEKVALVEAIEPGGFALLNADDVHAMSMAARTDERVVTFGHEHDADYRATGLNSTFPDRLALTVEWRGGSLPLRTNFIGDHFWAPVMAAVAAALEIGVAPETLAERVATFQPIFDRCGALSVPGGPHFIIDTVKAPWHSLTLPFEVLGRATATRKRLVLGQISDAPGADAKYRDAYRAGRAIADEVIFVGDHAHRSKASQEDRDKGRFTAFVTPKDAAAHIRATAVPGEVILLKGSRNLHLERIALAFVHDVKCWTPACGKMAGCVTCGLYEIPYEEHRAFRKKRRLRNWLTPWKKPAE